MTAALRLRYLLAKQGPALVAVILVLGAVLLAGAGVTYANSPTTEITDQTDVQTVSLTTTTAATVTGDTPLYERGRTLREQPVYLLGATPDADLTVTTAMPADTSGTVEHRIDLVYTANRDGDTFWKHSRSLPGETTRDGGQTVTTMSLSMPAMLDQMSAFQDEFGKAGTVSVALRISAVYTVGQYDGEFTETYPITFGDGWYSIETASTSNTHSTPVTRTQTLPLDQHLPFVLPLAGGLVLLLVGCVTRIAVRRLDGVHRDAMADDIHHARYAEWISAGTFPEESTSSTVQIQSLEALVDVAIDSGKRVIYDPSHGDYAVLDESVQYRYTPSDGATRKID